MIKTHDRRELDMICMGGGYYILTSAPEGYGRKEKPKDPITKFFENIVQGILPAKNEYTEATKRLIAFSEYVTETCGPDVTEKTTGTKFKPRT